MCAIDLSKAFDIVNDHALLMKLMKRKCLEFYSSMVRDCVLSYTFAVKFGVRHGSVLSLFLFAIYLDNIPVNRCLILSSFVVMYADGILLIAPSVSELQRRFHACKLELSCLDICINIKKSCCIRIGPRCDVKYASILTIKGHNIGLAKYDIWIHA